MRGGPHTQCDASHYLGQKLESFAPTSQQLILRLFGFPLFPAQTNASRTRPAEVTRSSSGEQDQIAGGKKRRTNSQDLARVDTATEL